MNLRRRLVTRTRQPTVNPAPHFDADRLRLLDHQFLQRRRVHSRHVRKPWTKAFIVWTTQRIVAQQVQMVADHHQRALRQPDVNTTSGVRQNKRLDPEQLESANRKSNFLERITFVVMYAALHRQYRHALDLARDQPSFMSLDRRSRKPGYLLVRNA